MNRSIIIYMLGWIMNMEAIFMTLPVVTAVVYRESIGFIYLGVAAVCGLLGFMCTRKKPCTKMFFAREGFVTVSLGWIVLSFFEMCIRDRPSAKPIPAIHGSMDMVSEACRQYANLPLGKEMQEV